MKTHIHTVITEALSDIGINDVAFTVEYPNLSEHGEYTTNAALIAGKQVGRNPRDLAATLKERVHEAIKDIERIDIAGPGFLNMYMSRAFFTDTTESARAAGDRWGTTDSESKREILIEYTSPNLFKPLHVGNLVGNIVGESLTRLAEMHSATVRRIGYPSDIGLTVAKGVWGLRKSGGNPEDIAALGEAYRAGNAAYESDETAKREIEEINAVLYGSSDPELMRLRDTGKITSLTHITDLCDTLGTTFDTTIFESDAAPVGMDMVRNHIADGIFEEDDGAVIFRGERHGLHTRVFVNSAGLPTYEAKDIGNFSIKQERYPDWDVSLVVTGSEQREYFKVIIAAIREVFHLPAEKKMEHIATGFLTLPDGKMSSRKGNVLTGESILADLQEEAMKHAKGMRADDTETLGRQIAVGALKYWILRQRVGSDIVFDTQQAFSFEGDSGPYLQYTHARTRSVLEKADEAGIIPSVAVHPDTVYAPERPLYQFGDAVAISYLNRSPHHLVNYLVKLAGTFNSWYAHERIADPQDKHAPYKVALTQSVGQTIRNGLWALGIPAPPRM